MNSPPRDRARPPSLPYRAYDCMVVALPRRMATRRVRRRLANMADHLGQSAVAAKQVGEAVSVAISDYGTSVNVDPLMHDFETYGIMSNVVELEHDSQNGREFQYRSHATHRSSESIQKAEDTSQGH